MTRSKRYAAWAGVLSLTLVVVWMVKPACACLPLEYAEVAVADLPDRARAEAEASAPGIVVGRAWIFGAGPEVAKGRGQGYLIRGRVPGGWWDSDVKVPFDHEPMTGGPVELQPIP
ncbi:hypothetical protein TA3x_002143 [Tundrisphaera sp. TA3]|uniref:hypothetical protein n=1 Tax=Tundrisphaera sp. TA3 TaxID=3435775 RepID=UPI003EBCCC06